MRVHKSYCAHAVYRQCLFSVFLCRFCDACYVYTLSIREATCVKESCVCESKRELDPSEITYWFEDGDHPRWPKKPQKVFCQRVYTAKGAGLPFCIYVMGHKTTVSASSLSSRDEKKFYCHYVRNESIFPHQEKILLATKAAVDTLKERLKFNSLFPKDYICARLSILEAEVADMCTKATDLSALACIQHKVSRFVSGVMQDPKCLKISEERQLNINELKPLFEAHDFISWDSFEENEHSVFGSSCPDLAFEKKSCRTDLFTASVKLPQYEVLEGFHEVVGNDFVEGTVEYKRMTITPQHFYQCYADMIRVANDSVVRRLRCGILVNSITVFALLVSHTNLSCVPMKYYSDFKAHPSILVGSEGNFAEFLYCILKK